MGECPSCPGPPRVAKAKERALEESNTKFAITNIILVHLNSIAFRFLIDIFFSIPVAVALGIAPGIIGVTGVIYIGV